ncbi:unnamed protein product [Urochloa humidicola]
MDLNSLDPSPGLTFLAKVRNSLGTSVTSSSPDAAASFWLLVSFSRSRFRLDASSVGLILQSVLGGQANLFSVVEVEELLFKFTVLNKNVGLSVYALGSYACPSFRLFFNLWNVKGFTLAKQAILLDKGP